MTDIPLLSLAIWLPIAGGLLVLASGDGRNVAFSKLIALVTARSVFLSPCRSISGSIRAVRRCSSSN
jgi:NADH:ubiquinone oxidoreductase subunit 4 (subunit M)